jgi:hypothetical protein
MRVAGVRVSPPFVRLLAEMLDDAGSVDTARKLADAIRVNAIEAPLTTDDHEAILVALGDNCPSGLARLRRELLDDQRRRCRAGL